MTDKPMTLDKTVIDTSKSKQIFDITGYNPWLNPIRFTFRTYQTTDAVIVGILQQNAINLIFFTLNNVGRLKFSLKLNYININEEISIKKYNDGNWYTIDVRPNENNVLSIYVNDILTIFYDTLSFTDIRFTNGILIKKGMWSHGDLDFNGELSVVEVANIGSF